MALLTPDVGEVQLLKYMLNAATPDNVKYHLYTNNKTPAEADVLSQFTSSASATGYNGPLTLTGSSWTLGTSSGTTTATYATITFSYTTTETVYGYYVTNNAATSLLWAEVFNSGSPFQIPVGGGTVNVTPKISLD